MIAQTYQVNGEDIVFEEFDGDLVILNLLTGQYFGMNPVAAKIWTALVQSTPGDQIEAAHTNPEAVRRYVQYLGELRLIKPADAPGVDLSDADKAAIAALTEVPKIDVFGDLSDLLIADPIHDVDEGAGWPKRPADTQIVLQPIDRADVICISPKTIEADIARVFTRLDRATLADCPVCLRHIALFTNGSAPK